MIEFEGQCVDGASAPDVVAAARARMDGGWQPYEDEVLPLLVAAAFKADLDPYESWQSQRPIEIWHQAYGTWSMPLDGADFRAAPLSGANLRELKFGSVDLSGADLSDADLRYATFIGCRLEGASLRGAQTAGLRLMGCDVQGANFSALDVSTFSLHDLELSGARFDDARALPAWIALALNSEGQYAKAALLMSLKQLAPGEVDGADLTGLRLKRASLSGIPLAGAVLEGAMLYRSKLDGADLRKARLKGARLRATDLRGADLSGADLRGLDLQGGDLRGANLTDARIDGMNFSDVALPGVIGLPDWAQAGLRADGRYTRSTLAQAMQNGSVHDLRWANLQKAHIPKAQLVGADLSGADFTLAYMPESDLSGAKLSGVSLWKVQLEGACLRGADLTGVRINHAVLKGADLEGARPWMAQSSFGAKYDGARCPAPDLLLMAESERRALSRWLTHHRNARVWAETAWGIARVEEMSALHRADR
ncbi:MAG: pentapeptide repeat-containing protein [Bradymonadia bacterium]